MRLKRLARDLYRIGTTDWYIIRNEYPPTGPRGRKSQVLYDIGHKPAGESTYSLIAEGPFNTLREARVHFAHM